MVGAARRRAWRVAGTGLGLAAIAIGGLQVIPAAASGTLLTTQLVRYLDTGVPGHGIDHATFPAGWSQSGYSAEGTLGYAFATSADGATTPLYECKVSGWDYMTSVFSNCEGTTMIGRLGYIFPHANSGVASGVSSTVELYRCRAGADHFDSTSSTCEGQKMDGPLGYLLRLVGTPSPRCAQSTLQDNVVCYANEALQGKLSVSGGDHPWPVGKPIPYSWGAGHDLTPGPTYGTPCPNNGDPDSCKVPVSQQPQNTLGLDCAGFTRWIYALAGNFDLRNGSVQAGYPGDSNSTEQLALGQHHVQIGAYRASTTTTPIPGDLVIFPDHVGIYVGPNKIIAEYQTGKDVGETPFPTTPLGMVHFTHV
jgi:hypothetical protein